MNLCSEKLAPLKIYSIWHIKKNLISSLKPDFFFWYKVYCQHRILKLFGCKFDSKKSLKFIKSNFSGKWSKLAKGISNIRWKEEFFFIFKRIVDVDLFNFHFIKYHKQFTTGLKTCINKYQRKRNFHFSTS